MDELVSQEIIAITKILDTGKFFEEDIGQAQDHIKALGLSKKQEMLRTGAIERQYSAAQRVALFPAGPKDKQIKELAEGNVWLRLTQESRLGEKISL